MDEDQFRELMSEVRSGFEAIVDAVDRINVDVPHFDQDKLIRALNPMDPMTDELGNVAGQLKRISDQIAKMGKSK